MGLAGNINTEQRQKKLQRAAAEEQRRHPGAVVEISAADEHRIGLKPFTRGVWAPVGKRPVAVGHHRFEWLYVTGFVEPATGRTVWNISNAICKDMFAAILFDFAKAADASNEAANACIQTHGGFGFAEDYDIERKFRETRLYQVAPISTNLILSYLSEHVLGLPRSY